jgi:hypothetical protein
MGRPRRAALPRPCRTDCRITRNRRLPPRALRCGQRSTATPRPRVANSTHRAPVRLRLVPSYPPWAEGVQRAICQGAVRCSLLSSWAWPNAVRQLALGGAPVDCVLGGDVRSGRASEGARELGQVIRVSVARRSSPLRAKDVMAIIGISDVAQLGADSAGPFEAGDAEPQPPRPKRWAVIAARTAGPFPRSRRRRGDAPPASGCPSSARCRT